MMNYAYDFSQSETEKYFEWILKKQQQKMEIVPVI